MRAPTRTGGDNTGGLSMARSRFRGSASWVTGSLAFRMLIPATSVGSDFKKISKSSRATVAHTNWRARHRRGKGRRYSKDALFAVGAEGTSVSDMPGDEVGRKPGMSVIVDTRRVASRTANRSQERQSTRRSDHSWPKR